MSFAIQGRAKNFSSKTILVSVLWSGRWADCGSTGRKIMASADSFDERHQPIKHVSEPQFHDRFVITFFSHFMCS